MTAYAPPAGDIEIVHADEALIVAVKPAGLLSVPGRGPDKADCLPARLAASFGEVLTVHRLDMATSGLIALARTAAVQAALSRAFRERQVEKRYVAIVAGRPSETSGEIDLPLITDWPKRPRQKVDHERGKPSLTRWRVLERGDEASRLELEPVTGRSHQLRVHLAAIGHPILGDGLYAPEPVRLAAPRMQLHACRLGFVHPVDGRPLRFDNAPDF